MHRIVPTPASATISQLADACDAGAARYQHRDHPPQPRANSLFRELDDERGFALPYWLECRTDDRHTATLARARGFTMSEERYAWLERPLAARLAQARHAPSAATLARLPRGFRLCELAGESEADSAAGARVSVKA